MLRPPGFDYRSRNANSPLTLFCEKTDLQHLAASFRKGPIMRIIGVLIPVAMVGGSVIMLGIHFGQNANSTFTTVGHKVGSAVGGIGGAGAGGTGKSGDGAESGSLI